MIYITQLLFVVEGEEEAFLRFEDTALRIVNKHGGKLLYRMRPQADAFVTASEELPYEVHVLTFPSREALESFLTDEERQQIVSDKERSVRHALVIEGQRW